MLCLRYYDWYQQTFFANTCIEWKKAPIEFVYGQKPTHMEYNKYILLNQSIFSWWKKTRELKPIFFYFSNYLAVVIKVWFKIIIYSIYDHHLSHLICVFCSWCFCHLLCFNLSFSCYMWGIGDRRNETSISIMLSIYLNSDILRRNSVQNTQSNTKRKREKEEQKNNTLFCIDFAVWQITCSDFLE